MLSVNAYAKIQSRKVLWIVVPERRSIPVEGDAGWVGGGGRTDSKLSTKRTTELEGFWYL